MTLSLETIIYLYLFVSFCIILFNIGCIIIRKKEAKALEKRSLNYKKLIQDHIEEKNIDSLHKEYLQKKLKKVNHLTAFHHAVTMLLKEDYEVRAYLKRYEEVFIYLIQIYMTKESVYQAYFAYLMSVYRICDEKEKNFITANLLEMTKDPSLYTRENAMKALISFGNAENVVNAIKGIERLGYTYNKKMLTDDLLEFKGDHEELIKLLLENLENFDILKQVGIINYITFKSGNDKIKTKFYQLLIKEETAKDIKLAIIRFFGKFQEEKVKELLKEYIKKEDTNYWEYAAVSAFALKNYQEKEVKNILIEALSHPNWYVRKNAAISLAKMKLTKNDVQKIMDKKDKYANEILSYELKKQKKGV